LVQVKEMGLHMLEQVDEHVGVTVEVVVSLPTVAAAYHHTQAAASHNRLQAENRWKHDLAVRRPFLNTIVLLSSA
jgi:hypothetical protein